MKNTIQAVVNQPIDKVFTTILSIIASKGYVITSSQKEGGLISFNTPRTIKTWGYNFNCTLIEKDANNTEVYLAGELKRYAITDWGEGDKIANNILQETFDLFRESTSPSANKKAETVIINPPKKKAERRKGLKYVFGAFILLLISFLFLNKDRLVNTFNISKKSIEQTNNHSTVVGIWKCGRFVIDLKNDGTVVEYNIQIDYDKAEQMSRRDFLKSNLNDLPKKTIEKANGKWVIKGDQLKLTMDAAKTLLMYTDLSIIKTGNEVTSLCYINEMTGQDLCYYRSAINSETP